MGNPLLISKPASLIKTLVVPAVENPIVLELDLNIPVSVSLLNEYAGEDAPDPLCPKIFPVIVPPLLSSKPKFASFTDPTVVKPLLDEFLILKLLLSPVST